jgi:hypothetical protein
MIHRARIDITHRDELSFGKLTSSGGFSAIFASRNLCNSHTRARVRALDRDLLQICRPLPLEGADRSARPAPQMPRISTF